jgi:hypothetical protein
MPTSSASSLLEPLQIGKLRVPGLIFGTNTRADVEDITAALEVTTAIAEQHLNCTAVHAYTVDRAVPVIRMYRDSWLKAR